MANSTPMLPDCGRCSRDHADAACRGLDDVVVGQNGAVGDLALSLMGGEGRTCTLSPHASHPPSAPAAVGGIGSQAVGGEVHVVLGRLPVPAPGPADGVERTPGGVPVRDQRSRSVTVMWHSAIVGRRVYGADGASRVVGDGLTDRTEQHDFEAAPAARAHHQHLGLVREPPAARNVAGHRPQHLAGTDAAG